MKALVVAWDSGGGVEAVQTVVRKLVGRGHNVRVLGTEGLRQRFESVGASFVRYRYAPENDCNQPETDILKDWEAKTRLQGARLVVDRVTAGPTASFCRDVREAVDADRPDVVVADFLIFPSLCAAEATKIPGIVVSHFAGGHRGRWRDTLIETAARRLFDRGLPAVNAARGDLGLPPIRHVRDLLEMAATNLLCTSPTFDFNAPRITGNRRYVGPQFDDQSPGSDDPWTGTNGRPRVLVSLSSTYMAQERLLDTAAEALGALPVQGLITTGPTIDPLTITAPDNVTVRRWVRHADALVSCSAVVCHGGHGTVIKALAAGVPLVVAPQGRDQPENAVRVCFAGAGVKVRKTPKVRSLRNAISRVLEEPDYRRKAEQLASAMAAERDDGLVIDELEHVAAAR